MIKTATIPELKKELMHLKPPKVIDLCTRLARFKKENKELLTYLLFEAHDEQTYIENIKSEIDLQFEATKKSVGLYLNTKSIRKVLRITKKHIRFSGNKNTEVQLLLYYCTKLKRSHMKLFQSTALENIFYGQIKKIKATIPSLHEDLQADYSRELEMILTSE